uniref:Uncharacterized protein n=1 Tax=Faxonius propinquus nudivirus TaxID=3139431 RepID=A0AAU8GBW1_9VIRU
MFPSYRHNYKYVPKCMFAGALTCGSRMSGTKASIVCDLHFDKIFRMKVQDDLLVSSSGQITPTKLVFTEDPGDPSNVMPFPFKFTNNNTELCLDDNALIGLIHNFIVSNSNLRHVQQEDIDRIVHILATWISSGQYVNLASGNSPMDFLQFTYAYENHLQKSWEKCWITVMDDNQSTFNFPMSKMPIFYQVLFDHMECSTIKSSNASIPIIGIPPNIVLNSKEMKFVTLKTDGPNKIFLHKDGATFASPIIMAGVREVASGTSTNPLTRVGGIYEMKPKVPSIC